MSKKVLLIVEFIVAALIGFLLGEAIPEKNQTVPEAPAPPVQETTVATPPKSDPVPVITGISELKYDLKNDIYTFEVTGEGEGLTYYVADVATGKPLSGKANAEGVFTVPSSKNEKYVVYAVDATGKQSEHKEIKGFVSKNLVSNPVTVEELNRLISERNSNNLNSALKGRAASAISLNFIGLKEDESRPTSLVEVISRLKRGTYASATASGLTYNRGILKSVTITVVYAD